MEPLIHKTLLSKPNLKKLTILYRLVLKQHRRTLPFNLIDICDQAAHYDFRNARQNYSNV
jgi:hypothetical protein